MEKTCCFASLCVVHIAQAHKPNREDGHRLGHQQQHPIQWFRISVCFCGVYQEYMNGGSRCGLFYRLSKTFLRNKI